MYGFLDDFLGWKNERCVTKLPKSLLLVKVGPSNDHTDFDRFVRCQPTLLAIIQDE